MASESSQRHTGEKCTQDILCGDSYEEFFKDLDDELITPPRQKTKPPKHASPVPIVSSDGIMRYKSSFDKNGKQVKVPHCVVFNVGRSSISVWYDAVKAIYGTDYRDSERELVLKDTPAQNGRRVQVFVRKSDGAETKYVSLYFYFTSGTITVQGSSDSIQHWHDADFDTIRQYVSNKTDGQSNTELDLSNLTISKTAGSVNSVPLNKKASLPNNINVQNEQNDTDTPDQGMNGACSVNQCNNNASVTEISTPGARVTTSTPVTTPSPVPSTVKRKLLNKAKAVRQSDCDRTQSTMQEAFSRLESIVNGQNKRIEGVEDSYKSLLQVASEEMKNMKAQYKSLEKLIAGIGKGDSSSASIENKRLSQECSDLKSKLKEVTSENQILRKQNQKLSENFDKVCSTDKVLYESVQELIKSQATVPTSSCVHSVVQPSPTDHNHTAKATKEAGNVPQTASTSVSDWSSSAQRSTFDLPSNCNIVIIGDSVVRDIKPSRFSPGDQVHKVSKAGLSSTVKQVGAFVKKQNSNMCVKWVVFHTGINDMKLNTESSLHVGECSKEFMTAIGESKQKFPNATIIVSGIVENTKNITVRNRVMAVNCLLREMCIGDERLRYCDNDKMCGVPSNFSDEFHLSDRGVGRLVINLKTCMGLRSGNSSKRVPPYSMANPTPPNSNKQPRRQNNWQNSAIDRGPSAKEYRQPSAFAEQNQPAIRPPTPPEYQPIIDARRTPNLHLMQNHGLASPVPTNMMYGSHLEESRVPSYPDRFRPSSTGPHSGYNPPLQPPVHDYMPSTQTQIPHQVPFSYKCGWPQFAPFGNPGHWRGLN